MNQNNCHHTKAQIDTFAAISKQQRQDVYSHIANCEECADYKEVADSTADLLGSLNTTLQQPENSTFSSFNDTANTMMPHIHERVKRGRRLTWLALSVMASSALALLWFYSQSTLTLVGGIVLADWALGGGVVAWWAARQSGKFASLSAVSSQGFLSGWAKELHWEIKFTTAIAWIVLFEVAFGLFKVISDGLAIEQSLVLLVVNGVLAIGVIYAFVIELPALKNELSLIKEDP